MSDLNRSDEVDNYEVDSIFVELYFGSEERFA